jgi:hypothetical protein
MAIINPAQIEWHGKEVQSMAQAIFDDIYSNPELNRIHVIIEGIVALEQIVFLGTLEKITKADAGCGTGETSPTIPMSEKFWTPAKVKIWLSECADTLEESFWIWGTRKGINRDDLTATDFAEFVMSRMQSAMLEDVMRIVWFGNVNAANYSDTTTGVITDGVSVDDYNIIDGLWEQAYEAVAADPSLRTTIALNAEATYANQAFDATDTTNKLAHSILQSVVDNADYRLKGKPGAFLLVTDSIYSQYKRELKSYTAINDAWIMVQDGKMELSFDGIPVIPINFWDRTIRADMDSGEAYFQPHRVFYTVRENIPIGFDDSSAIRDMQQYYDPQTEKTNWKSKYRIDTKILKNYLIHVAY